jgi:hypothetical protein
MDGTCRKASIMHTAFTSAPVHLCSFAVFPEEGGVSAAADGR